MKKSDIKTAIKEGKRVCLNNNQISIKEIDGKLCWVSPNNQSKFYRLENDDLKNVFIDTYNGYYKDTNGNQKKSKINAEIKNENSIAHYIRGLKGTIEQTNLIDKTQKSWIELWKSNSGMTALIDKSEIQLVKFTFNKPIDIFGNGNLLRHIGLRKNQIKLI